MQIAVEEMWWEGNDFVIREKITGDDFRFTNMVFG